MIQYHKFSFNHNSFIGAVTTSFPIYSYNVQLPECLHRPVKLGYPWRNTPPEKRRKFSVHIGRNHFLPFWNGQILPGKQTPIAHFLPKNSKKLSRKTTWFSRISNFKFFFASPRTTYVLLNQLHPQKGPPGDLSGDGSVAKKHAIK